MNRVAVVGVGLHPFGKFPDVTSAEMCRRVSLEALDDAGMSWDDVDAVVVGSSRFSGGLARGLGASDLLADMGLSGIPAFNVAAACATGGSAVSLAHLLVEAGRAGTVLVVGGEKMPKGFIPRSPGAAEDATDVDYLRWAAVAMPNPAYWALECARRCHDHGTTDHQLAAVTVKARAVGAHNPYARYRKPLPVEEVLASPMVASPLRLFEICAVSDGAAAVVLTTAARAQSSPSTPVWIAASEVATAAYGDPQLTMPGVATSPAEGGIYVSEVTLAVRRALERAGVEPPDVDLIELSDNSVWQELAYPELWGFCEPGEMDHLVETGATYPDGRLPINPSGGFLCTGEATVAMGIFQVCELTWQLRGQAGSRQVEGANVGLAQTLGLGGYGTATVLKR